MTTRDFAFLGAWLLLLFLFVRYFPRACRFADVVEEWAEDNFYEVVEFDPDGRLCLDRLKLWWMGVTTTTVQSVGRVKVRDRRGDVHTFLMVYGDYYFGTIKPTLRAVRLPSDPPRGSK